MEYLFISFDDFLKVAPLSEDCSKATQTFPKKDKWRFPKACKEDPNMFGSYKINEVINMFTSEEMENMPLDSQMWFHVSFTSGVHVFSS